MTTTHEWLVQSGWGGGPVRLLGAGAFGEAWLLRDGTVAKLTWDDDEALCVRELVRGLRSVHWPVVLEATETPPLQWHGSTIPEDQEDPHHQAHFAWRREELSPVPGLEGGPPWSPRRRRVLVPLFDLVVRDGIVPVDAMNLSNWGQRADGTIVYRDPSCAIAEASPHRFAGQLVLWIRELLRAVSPGKAVETLWFVNESLDRLPTDARRKVVEAIRSRSSELPGDSGRVLRSVFREAAPGSR